MSRKFIPFIVLLALLPLVCAQEQSEEKIDEKSYQNSASYEDPEFYKKSDPAKWNYEDPKFDWKKIPTEQIAKIPPKKLKYSELSEVQRKGREERVNGRLIKTTGGMGPEQIAENFNNIENLRDVPYENVQKAFLSVFKVRLTLLSGSGARIHDGALIAIPGPGGNRNDRISLATLAFGLSVMVHKDGTIEFFPKVQRREDNVPLVPLSSDRFALDTLAPTGIQLEKGLIYLSGKNLRFEEGNIFVPKTDAYGLESGTGPWINGVKFGSTLNDVVITLSDKLPEKSDKTQVVITPSSIGFFTMPNEEIQADAWSRPFKNRIAASETVLNRHSDVHKIFQMYTADYEVTWDGKVTPYTQYSEAQGYLRDARGNRYRAAVDEHDQLKLTVSNGDSLTVQNRETENLVPLVNHISSENGRTNIENGRFQITLSTNGFDLRPPGRMGSHQSYLAGLVPETVAMQIQTDAKPNQYLLMNAYDQFKISNDRGPELFYDYKKYGNAPISPFMTDNLIQTMRALQVAKFPDLKVLEVPGADSWAQTPAFAVHMIDAYFTANPNDLSASRYVRFISDTQYRNAYARGATEVGLSGWSLDPYNVGFPFRPMNPYQLLLHEIRAHARDLQLAEMEGQFLDKNPDSKEKTFQQLINERILSVFRDVSKDPDFKKVHGTTPISTVEIHSYYSGSNQDLKKQYVDILEKKYGLPAVYAFYKNPFSGNYMELTSTLFEEDPDFIRDKVNTRRTPQDRMVSDFTAWVLNMKKDAGSPHPDHDYITQNYCAKNPKSCQPCANYKLLCNR